MIEWLFNLLAAGHLGGFSTSAEDSTEVLSQVVCPQRRYRCSGRRVRQHPAVEKDFMYLIAFYFLLWGPLCKSEGHVCSFHFFWDLLVSCNPTAAGSFGPNPLFKKKGRGRTTRGREEQRHARCGEGREGALGEGR
jgi:hypothetical protein